MRLVVVCGPTASGRTSYVLTEIHKQGLDKKGEKVIILCSESEQNDVAHSLLKQAEIETTQEWKFETSVAAIVLEDSYSRRLLKSRELKDLLFLTKDPVYIITRPMDLIPRDLPPFKLVILGEPLPHHLKQIARIDFEDWEWFPTYPKIGPDQFHSCDTFCNEA